MRLRIITLIVLCLSLVGCDHATKAWAEHALSQTPPLQLWQGLLDLRYAQNHDVAFNLLRWIPEGPRYIAIVTLGISASALLLWLWRREAHTHVRQLALAMLFAGAIGNLLDRLLRGYVVDFIHLVHWPIFNVADVLIVAGALLWLWPQKQKPLQPT